MTVLDELLSKLPKDAGITSSNYEGANIVLYTKNKTFFLHGGDIIRQLVSEFKKRIELRADDAIRKDEEKTEKFIREVIPKEADITQILFESALSTIIIEAKRPGLAIGRDGELLRRIKEETFWVAEVRRESLLPSKITTNIRNVLFTESDYRRKFLHKVGQRIYEIKKATVDDMWARISILGAGREVGRSCFLLQTPESRILIDCGLNVAASGRYAFPYLNVPEFHIDELDAVVISHSHLDHCLTPDTLVQLSDGEIAPISEINSGQAVEALDFKYSMRIENIPAIQRGAIEAPNPICDVRTQTKRIKATGNHPVFVLDEYGNFQIKHIEQLKPGDFIATPRMLDIAGAKQALPKLNGQAIELNKDAAQVLGYILGDGGKREPGAIYITDKNIDNLKFYSEKLERLGVKNKINLGERNRINIYSAEFKRWIENVSPNIVSLSNTRRVPKVICKSKKPVVGAFLRGLYDAEGCVKHHSIVLSTSSNALAVMAQMLLLRFGIISHLYDHDQSKSTFGGGPAYQVCISHPESLKLFLEIIRFSDNKKAAKLRAMLKRVGCGIKRIDLIPIRDKFVLELAYELGLRKTDLKNLGFHYTHYAKHYPSREKLGEICKKLSAIAERKGIKSDKLNSLVKLASSPILWDKVTGIKVLGTEKKRSL